MRATVLLIAVLLSYPLAALPLVPYGIILADKVRAADAGRAPADLDLWFALLTPLILFCTALWTAIMMHTCWCWAARHGARRAAICAACGYDLHGLTPEPDGCTVCPECGAAWRLAERP
jgi:hypothetical protein